MLDKRIHFKATENFQYTHFSACHPLNTQKGFITETLRLLPTKSVKENFENFKQDCEQRLCKRGYPLTLVKKHSQGSSIRPNRKEAPRSKSKQGNEMLPFITTYNPAVPNPKEILMKLTATLSRTTGVRFWKVLITFRARKAILSAHGLP